MLRSIKRNIAKNRMKDAEVDKVNRRMSIRQNRTDAPSRIKIAKMSKTAQGRRKLAVIFRKNPPMWKSVLTGEFRKEADKAFIKKSQEREFRRHPEKAEEAAQKIRKHGRPVPANSPIRRSAPV